MTDPFKDLIWDNVVRAALAALMAAIPFLALPGLSLLVTLVVTTFANLVYDSIRELIDLRTISLKNEEHRREFDKAAIALRLLEKDFGPDSAEYKAARERHREALAQFVRWRTSARV